jgi:hypothetical protein
MLLPQPPPHYRHAISSGINVGVGVGLGKKSSVSYEIGLVWFHEIKKVID